MKFLVLAKDGTILLNTDDQIHALKFWSSIWGFNETTKKSTIVEFHRDSGEVIPLNFQAREIQTALTLCELLEIVPERLEKSPYSGIEIWFDDFCITLVDSLVDSFAYTKQKNLPGDWVDQGDYQILNLL